METVALVEVLQQGGILLVVLLGMGIVAVGTFFERWFFYRRESFNVGEFLKGVVTLVRKQHFAEALDRCDEAHGPAVQIVRAALEYRRLPRSELRQLLHEVATLQLPRLERHLFLLSVIATVSPLLGLLGTVLGMMDTFGTMEAARGSATSATLAGGVWEALLSSAAGLSVGIIATAAHHVLLAHVRQFCAEMSRASIEMLQAFVADGDLLAEHYPQEEPPVLQQTPAEATKNL